MDGEWTTATVGDLARARGERALPQVDSDLPYIGMEHIEADSGRLLRFGRAGETVSLKTPFEVGDILYGKLRPALRKVMRAPMGGVASTEILAIVPRQESDLAFVQHLLHSDQMLAWALQGAAGTKMPRTSWDRLSRYEFACPSASERKGIGATLDAIDGAIEKTEAVITATEELRKALLQELLTRGVPGWHTEWKSAPGIGEIPACWEVVRLGDVADVKSGIAMGPHRRARSDGTPYLTVAHVQANKVSVSDARFMHLTPAEIGTGTLMAGDLVLVEGHADITQLGRGALIPDEAAGFAFQNHLFRVRGHARKLLNGFACAVINGRLGRDYFALFGGTTSGLNTVSSENVRRMPIPVPPEREQARVLEALSVTDMAIQSERRNLSEGRNLKQCVADALLSGRTRVRTAASSTNSE